MGMILLQQESISLMDEREIEFECVGRHTAMRVAAATYCLGGSPPGNSIITVHLEALNLILSVP